MIKMFMKSRRKMGFTLTELIIVVSILAILATLVTPLVGDMISSSREKTDMANAKELENAIARAIARQDLTVVGGVLKDSTGAAIDGVDDLTGAIGDEIKAIPTNQVADMHFYVCVEDVTTETLAGWAYSAKACKVGNVIYADQTANLPGPTYVDDGTKDHFFRFN